jgi:DNA polymerase-3 subunit beta
MKIIVDGLDLSDAVATVARAASARAVNPVLEGIKLVAAGDTLTLSATDLDIYIQKTIRADVKSEGTVVVPGRLFSEYVRKVAGSGISLTSEGDNVIITHGDSVCNFQCLMPSEYPNIINLNSKPHFSIKADALRDLISKTIVSASADDSRPVLKGVLLEIKGEKITGVALDGFRLSTCEKQIANYKLDTSIIIPARSLDEARKQLDGNDDINIIIENKFFQVNVNNTTFAGRLIDGDYINYKQIIPTTFESSIVIEKTAFEQSVERAGLLVRNDKVNLVSLKISDKQVGITSNNEIGKIAEKIPASLTGKDMTISFNARYLFDALKSINSEFIKMSFNTEVSPCIITGTKDSDFLFLILPVRMN